MIWNHKKNGVRLDESKINVVLTNLEGRTHILKIHAKIMSVHLIEFCNDEINAIK